jgi:hypothetical protein
MRLDWWMRHRMRRNWRNLLTRHSPCCNSPHAGPCPPRFGSPRCCCACPMRKARSPLDVLACSHAVNVSPLVLARHVLAVNRCSCHLLAERIAERFRSPKLGSRARHVPLRNVYPHLLPLHLISLRLVPVVPIHLPREIRHKQQQMTSSLAQSSGILRALLLSSQHAQAATQPSSNPRSQPRQRDGDPLPCAEPDGRPWPWPTASWPC